MSHVRTHCLSEKFVCGKCGALFNESSLYQAHLLFHQKIYCNKCRKELQLESHSDTNRHQCAVCSETLGDEHRLEAHKSRHLEFKNLPCENCKGKLYEDSWSTNYLSKQTQDSVKCMLCNETFSHILLLAYHAEKCHKVLVCKVCTKQFALQESLAEHLESHSKVHPFVCSVCNKSYQHNIWLTNHKKSHTSEIPKALGLSEAIVKVLSVPRAFLCSECGESFFLQEFLDLHKKTCHTSVRDTVQTSTETSLRDPVQKNTEAQLGDTVRKNTINCTSCNKTFKTCKNLKIHLKIHDDPANQCEICNKKFYHRSTLNRHLRQRHNIIPKRKTSALI